MENYMLRSGQCFFGKGLTRVTVFMDNGKCYPHATGEVSRELDEACRKLRGKSLTFFEVQNQLWKLINKKG